MTGWEGTGKEEKGGGREGKVYTKYIVGIQTKLRKQISCGLFIVKGGRKHLQWLASGQFRFPPRLHLAST